MLPCTSVPHIIRMPNRTPVTNGTGVTHGTLASNGTRVPHFWPVLPEVGIFR